MPTRPFTKTPPAPPTKRRTPTLDFEAASQIVRVLEPLPEDSRERVLRVATILLGLDAKERP